MAYFDETFIQDPTEDYYKIIGCTELSSMEQILTEYRLKAKKIHPDKNLNDPTAKCNFARLQEAKEVLTDPHQRKEYDRWRNCGIAISYKKWKTIGGSVKISMHWAAKDKTNPMIDCPARKDLHAGPSDAFSQETGEMFQNFPETIRKFRNYEI